MQDELIDRVLHNSINLSLIKDETFALCALTVRNNRQLKIVSLLKFNLIIALLIKDDFFLIWYLLPFTGIACTS